MSVPRETEPRAARGIQDALFIIGVPRSGTTVLQRTLSLHESLWGPFGESHDVLEGPFRPRIDELESNRVQASQLTPAIASALHAHFWRVSVQVADAFSDDMELSRTEGRVARLRLRAKAMRARSLQAPLRPSQIHLLEKTPKNCLRVPMLSALVPDGRFVFILRDPVRTMDSLIAGWRSYDRFGPLRRKRYGTYRVGSRLRLADYHDPWWCFALIPGWSGLSGRTVAEVAAEQLRACLLTAATDLAALAANRRLVVDYESFVRAPVEEVSRILSWAGLAITPRVARFAALQVRAPERAVRNAAAIESVKEIWGPAVEQVRQLTGAW